ncbi:MAG: OmpH family outer membrane protein [Deltaproteobacteria bacterium]|nr:OmpH family outer membrane protein [Deltaproteobacteria bacterium]
MKKQMKQQMTALVVIALVSLGLSGRAFGADIKIGLVNFQKALNEVDQGKKAKELLKTEFDAKQKKLNVQQDELKKLQADAEKQKSVLSQDALLEKQKAFNEKYLDLQKSMGSYREELVAKDTKLTSLILQNLKKVVAQIGEKGGYTLIVEGSQDAVLYAKSQEDLTDKVVALYNEQNKGPLKLE